MAKAHVPTHSTVVHPARAPNLLEDLSMACSNLVMASCASLRGGSPVELQFKLMFAGLLQGVAAARKYKTIFANINLQK